MFLKSLDIYGFKSFADHTHIDFADGITALLGPNGCGKSNVVDAIKWVLAENKTKNLRAEKKEDVIFNGTESRPALNVAEVTLTINNENNMLSLEATEIAIKRRLFRSGENQYFINGNEASSREVLKLFMDTGIGKSSYSIMEQGQVSQILSSKPEDRRYIFEEAAGVSKSKQECAAGDRDIQQTKENLRVSEAELKELKSRYETLKTQADKAIKCKKLKEQIFEYDRDIALLRLKNSSEDSYRRKEELDQLIIKRDEVRSDIDAIQEAINNDVSKQKDIQDRIYDKQAELMQLQTQVSGLKNEKSIREKQKLGITDKIGVLEVRINTCQESIENIQDEIDENESQLYDYRKSLLEFEDNITKYNDEIKVANTQITSNEAIIDKNKQSIDSLYDERGDLQHELTSITEDIVTLLDQKLKEAGFSEENLKESKTKTLNLISRLKNYSENRISILNDYTEQKIKNEAASLVSDLKSDFGQIINIGNDLEASFNDYIKSSPSFISEFLSPEGIMTQKRGIDANLKHNQEEINRLSKENEALESDNLAFGIEIDNFKTTLNGLRENKAALEASIKGAQKENEIRRQSLVKENQNLKGLETELDEENTLLEDINEQINETYENIAETEAMGAKVAEELGALNELVKNSNSNQKDKEKTLIEKRNLQDKYQERIGELSIKLTNSDSDIRNIKDNFSEKHNRDLMEFEELMYKITDSITVLRDKLLTCKDELSSCGSNVNYMAVEEFNDAKELYERKKKSYEDVKEGLEKLIRVNEEIKNKASENFYNTYKLIKKNFQHMFKRMFGGGKGELKLTDPHNILTSGIEILAQPPGKKLENISLLSGGEKTMTAVALLFATYQVKASPFCLLDEIDAALDDKNVSSLVATLESFSSVSQYIVITHNKKTVMGASSMLGITMEEHGVSKIVALRLEEDFKLGTRMTTEDVEEEEEIAEEDVYIPPRPEKRIYNEDGTIEDPLIIRIRKEEEEKAQEERRLAREAKRLEEQKAQEADSSV